MKTLSQTAKTLNTALIAPLVAAMALLASACGMIPSEYRGEFTDASTGTSLKLTRAKGTLRTTEGHVLSLKADNIDFERLSSGKPGILVDSNPVSTNLLEIFWVNPDMSTLGKGGGLVWFDAEVLYAQFDQNASSKVDAIPMFHCEDGGVMLDTVTHRWQIGCPKGPRRYEMRRVK